MSNKRCPKCGFPRETETGDDICPRCGWIFSSIYEKVEIRNNEDCSTKAVRLHSKKVAYYEYDPNTSLFYEDACGNCYQGICNSSSTSTKVSIYKLKTKQHCPEYLLRRLERESCICISHTNVIPILDFITVRDDLHSDDYEFYFVEKYFFRVSLSDFLQGKICDSKGDETKRINELYSLHLRDRSKFARKIITDILQGLVYLHEKGVYMSIIDPDCIYITNDGTVKLTTTRRYLYDIYSNQRHYYRMTGTFIRCFPGNFVSPEIILYEDLIKIGYRSDFYSVGILFFQLLTGHCPYNGQLPDILYQQVHARIPIKEIEDKSLRKCIKKATEKNPAKRFQSALEFLKALEDGMNVRIPWYKKLFVFFHKGNRKQCILLSILFAFTFFPTSEAQNTMCINYKDGSVYEVPIERIDSITFIEKSDEPHEITLIGDWFWGNREKGYYELLTFKEDRTYTGYDYYLEYGFDTWTYGTYMANGIILNLWSNGYGYRHTYRWFVSTLTENALEVMTQMGGFTYYRVQPEIYSLKVGEESYECIDGDYYVFSDGVKISDNEGKLKGINEGTTYILKYDAKSELIKAYKVIVDK